MRQAYTHALCFALVQRFALRLAGRFVFRPARCQRAHSLVKSVMCFGFQREPLREGEFSFTC